MISIEDYKKNPCRVSSVPYWKARRITVPSAIKIVHDNEFDQKLLDHYFDRRFFRLIHDLSNIPDLHVTGIQFSVLSSNGYDGLMEMINDSYAHSGICVSADDIISWTKTPVYCPELWIGAFLNEKLIGSILCDFDREAGEAVIEWLQVLPGYRCRGIASALICSALRAMSSFSDFATVSGECDNITDPERVYRKCGFAGNDVWHILNEKS